MHQKLIQFLNFKLCDNIQESTTGACKANKVGIYMQANISVIDQHVSKILELISDNRIHLFLDLLETLI